MACDPPFDWSAVAGPEGLDPFLDREKNIAAVIEAEVLEKGRKALMLFGVHHLMRGMGSAVDAYERHGFANLTYVIADHRGFGNHTALNSDNDELESRLLSWAPALNPAGSRDLARDARFGVRRRRAGTGRLSRRRRPSIRRSP